ncbi:universal stress protein [Maribacter sp. CXY002]|uniref:universal stress protein n=1 Tax=Maribacter luteocoastalis TaxID=3407671 RepID=UPI003B674035
MKNFLVATDFSHDAYNALFYCTQLMKWHPCTFYILNVYNETTVLESKKEQILPSKKLLEELKIQSNEKLTHTFHKIVLDNNNARHTFKTISKKGKLTSVLKNIVNEKQIDLVVMGSKGETGAKEIFLGSNTVKVAKSITQCPILAIPKQIDYKEPKEIAFITDYKTGCSKETIAPLLYLANLSKASIRIMHIHEEQILNSEQETHRIQLDACLEHIEHSFHWMQEFTEKAKVIDTFLEKLTIDMFAMVYHQRSFLERLIREPVIKDLSIYAEIPFLILPERD